MDFFQFGDKKSVAQSEINGIKKDSLHLISKEGKEYHLTMTQTHFRESKMKGLRNNPDFDISNYTTFRGWGGISQVLANGS